MSEPTPRPWKFSEYSSPAGWLEGANGDTIWHVDEDGNDLPNKANAALIVRAVNCHDELVAALATMLDLWMRHCGKWSVRDQVADCRVILNKARGETL